MYSSQFPATPYIDSYLREGRMTGEGETARDMVNRVVAELADADRRFDPDGTSFTLHLGEAMDTRRIVFSTPIMTNAGRYPTRPLAACAVPPVSLRGDLSQIKSVVDDYHRAGMGTGFNLDDLDDPVTVLRYLNQVAVLGAASGTEDRPVGNMAILSLSHPAAGEFITCKVGADARGEDWKFNISLHVTDAEMRAADIPGREHDLLSATADAAFECADPGLVFTDRMNEANPTPHIGAYVSTAPCGEVGLVTGETCQFGYINLGRFHSPGRAVPVDLDDLAATVRLLVRALDDALETSLTRYPHVQSAMIMTAKRKIGVGICGLADLLLAAGLPYDSDAGRQLAMDMIAYVNYVSKQASADLATTRGACPAVLDGRSRYTDPAFLQRFADISTRTVTAEDWSVLASQIASTGQLRNSSTIAIPPTGRSSPVIGASTGIEPLFRLTDPHLPGQLHPGAQSALRASGRADLLDFVLSYGRLPNDNVHAALRALLATATQIAPGGHLAMAAAVQGCTDEAVAKTVNLPQTANTCDIRDIYRTAWEAGCKGITVYRDGSRTIQPKAL